MGECDTKDNKQLAFYCPFCNHHKKKLNVNIEKNVYHCWVCDVKGRNILSLLKRLNTSNEKLEQLASELKNNNFYININQKDEKENAHRVFLPSEYKIFNGSKDPYQLNAYNYLTRIKKLTDEKIKKYNIGYCDEGLYKDRVIIPSYDDNGNVNYFVARAIYSNMPKKYLNPKINKEIFPFELYVTFNFPIIFVEGVFDAISIDFNSVPILGNTISDYMIETLVGHDVESVYLFLDGDAKKFLYRNCKKFIENNIYPTVILPSNKRKDPGESSQEEINLAFKNKIYITEENLNLLKGL